MPFVIPPLANTACNEDNMRWFTFDNINDATTNNLRAVWTCENVCPVREQCLALYREHAKLLTPKSGPRGDHTVIAAGLLWKAGKVREPGTAFREGIRRYSLYRRLKTLKETSA